MRYASFVRISTVPGTLDSLGVIGGVLAAKYTVCWLSKSQGGSMLSPHSTEPAYRVISYVCDCMNTRMRFWLYHSFELGGFKGSWMLWKSFTACPPPNVRYAGSTLCGEGISYLVIVLSQHTVWYQMYVTLWIYVQVQIPEILDGLGVVDCMLAAKRTACSFRAAQGKHMLSPHSAGQYTVWCYCLNPMKPMSTRDSPHAMRRFTWCN